MRAKHFVWLLIAFLLCGCTKLKFLPYLDQALVLQDFAKDKGAQTKFVDNVDANYEKLLQVVKSGTIVNYKTEQDILKAFGEPILTVQVTEDGQGFKRALYRYALWKKGLDKDRVYLFYDKQGQLTKWTLEPFSFQL